MTVPPIAPDKLTTVTRSGSIKVVINTMVFTVNIKQFRFIKFAFSSLAISSKNLISPSKVFNIGINCKG